MNNDLELLNRLIQDIERRRPALDRIREYWENASPLAFISKESREALRGTMSRLGVNLTRVVVNSHTERETVRGFVDGGDSKPNAALLQLWRKMGLAAKSELVHTDRALYGNSYVTVWGSIANPTRPVALLDSPSTATVLTDPGTGERLAALRVWKDDNLRRAAVWTADTLRTYQAPWQDDLSATTWTLTHEDLNALEVVPVVEFARRESIGDMGTSVAADIFDLSDALAKLLTDAMVTSEDYAKPRRFATGLEIEEDEDGNVINPFGRGRNLQSEAPETKFGQLSGASVDSYTGLIATLTQLAGMLTGLPPHYLGLHGDQPSSADAVRAAEAQLISRVHDEIRKLSGPWAEVMALAVAVQSGGTVSFWDSDISTVFESPELRTPNQAADAAVKLGSLGIPLRTLLKDPLDYSEDDVNDIMTAVDADRAAKLALARALRTIEAVENE